MHDLQSSWSEWSARDLRPVAQWVSVPSADRAGRSELRMVWSVPEVPSAVTLDGLPRQAQR